MSTLVRAAMVVDADHVVCAPGALLLDGDRVVAAGSPQSIGGPADAEVIDCPSEVILPGLVNAHAHLDLSAIGPLAYQGDFIAWIDMVRRRRPQGAEAIAAAVGRGIELVQAGGTVLVGDIAGSHHAAETLVASGLGGTSFLELFGLGAGEAAGIDRLSAALHNLPPSHGSMRVGLEPHAPYSCGPGLYRAAAIGGRPLTTHLAETPDEKQFTLHGTGRFRDFLEAIGKWDASIARPGTAPVAATLDAVAGARLLAAHLNYIELQDLERLATHPVDVVYCPRASAYFGHPSPGFPPHAYRAMLDAGITVALGTDSVICLDTPNRVSVLDEMRLLFERDGVDPRTLLRMATTEGAVALGRDPTLVTFAPGRAAGVLAVPFTDDGADPLRQVLRSTSAPRWLLQPDWRHRDG